MRQAAASRRAPCRALPEHHASQEHRAFEENHDGCGQPIDKRRLDLWGGRGA